MAEPSRPKQYFSAEKIYVAVGALKASGISVSLLDKTNQLVDVDVPTIQNMVGGGITVNTAVERSNTITFHGTQNLAVAAKVAQLKVDERGFWVSERLLTGNSLGIRETAPAKPDYLVGDELYLY